MDNGAGVMNVRLKFGLMKLVALATEIYVVNTRKEYMMAFLKRSGIMLAHPADAKRVSNFPCIADDELTGKKIRTFFHQPKLNGERGRVDGLILCRMLLVVMVTSLSSLS